jgi:DivIVA domain-containing protein
MALTPEDVVNKRFQATKFREGYDQDEVDDFLDEVVNELRRLNEENDDLRNKLGTCERRVGELSRASVGRDGPPDLEIITSPPMPAPAVPVQASVAPMVSMAEPARSGGSSAQLEAVGQGPEAAAGMLALAQKLHDEYVRNGEQQRDRIVTEAREHAQRLVREAEEKQRQTLGSLEQERSTLERKIDELRAFEREYRSRLKSYLEGQLRDLEAKAAVAPRGNPTPALATNGASASNGNSISSGYGNSLPNRASYSAEPAAEPAVPGYPFGDRN